MQVSGGVGAGSARSLFLLSSGESEASHVACFCFSALFRAAPGGPPDESRARIVPRWPTGAGVGPPFFGFPRGDHRVLP